MKKLMFGKMNIIVIKKNNKSCVLIKLFKVLLSGLKILTER